MLQEVPLLFIQVRILSDGAMPDPHRDLSLRMFCHRALPCDFFRHRPVWLIDLPVYLRLLLAGGADGLVTGERSFDEPSRRRRASLGRRLR